MRPYPRAALFFVLATTGASLRAADPPRKEENPLEALGRFVAKYHEKPAPDAVPQHLKTLLGEDTLKQLNPHVFELLAHAFGHIGRGNVKLVRLYEESMNNASGRGKVMLIRILRLCGDADTIT